MLKDIVAALIKRQDDGVSTTLVKVRGHSGDPLTSFHALADNRVVRGAQQDEEEAEYAAGRPDCILYSWVKSGEECTYPWGPQTKRRVKSVAGEHAWADHAWWTHS